MDVFGLFCLQTFPSKKKKMKGNWKRDEIGWRWRVIPLNVRKRKKFFSFFFFVRVNKPNCPLFYLPSHYLFIAMFFDLKLHRNVRIRYIHFRHFILNIKLHNWRNKSRKTFFFFLYIKERRLFVRVPLLKKQWEMVKTKKKKKLTKDKNMVQHTIICKLNKNNSNFGKWFRMMLWTNIKLFNEVKKKTKIKYFITID